MNKLLALIVEDDSDLARLLSMALQAAGFETEIALAGDEALEWLEGAEPDVVVLDLFLPHVGGAEILRQIRADPRLAKTRVIVVTASVRAAEIQVLQDQADLIFVKPLDFVHLRDLAARLVSAEASDEPVE